MIFIPVGRVVSKGLPKVIHCTFVLYRGGECSEIQKLRDQSCVTKGVMTLSLPSVGVPIFRDEGKIVMARPSGSNFSPILVKIGFSMKFTSGRRVFASAMKVKG